MRCRLLLPLGVAGLCATLLAVGLTSFLTLRAQNAAPPSLYEYLPGESLLAAHVDLAQLWNHAAFRRWHADNETLVTKISEEMDARLGIRLTDLESAAVFLLPPKEDEPSPNLGVLLRSRKPWNEQTVQRLTNEMANNPRNACRLLDRHTLLLGKNLKEEDLSLKAVPVDRARGPLGEVLRDAARQRPFAFATLQPSRLPAEALRGLEGPFEPLARLLQSTRLATLNVTLGPAQVTAELRLDAASAEAAAANTKDLALLRKSLLQLASEALQELKEQAENQKALEPVHVCLAALTEALEKGDLSSRGNATYLRLHVDVSNLPVANFLFSGVQKVRESATNVKSANNLKQIALALHCYHDEHGAFPPAAVVGKNGKPLLSWRVLILPYIEQAVLYREFRLDEPWDSEHNKKLIPKIPDLYVLPGEEQTEGKQGLTRYRVFVGNGAAWEWGKGLKIADFIDGTSNTWMVVLAKEAVPWTKPDELPFDPKKDPSALLGKIGDRWQVAFCDGSVRMFQKLPKADVIRALITRSGGEIIPDDD